MHHRSGMPLHIITHGAPIAIIERIASQHSFIISICPLSIGVILHIMPSLPISQVMRHIMLIMGIIACMPVPIIGIIPGMPIMGIPIIGIAPGMPVMGVIAAPGDMGMADIGMPVPIIGIIPGCIIGICVVAGIIGGTLLRACWWRASGLLRAGS